MRGNGIEINLCRTKTLVDMEADKRPFEDINLPENVMTPGVAIIYLIQAVPQ